VPSIADAQRSVFSADVGATMAEGATAFRDGDIEVVVDAGSRLSARLDPGGVHLGSDPGILIKVKRAPDMRLTHVRWDFRTARFDATASADWADLFGLLGRVGAWKIEQVLNAKLKPLLPDAVRRAGYSPNRDPDLQATIGQLSRMFDFAQTPAAAGARGGPGAGNLRDPSAGLQLSMPEDFVVPLGEGGLQMTIARGTSLSIAARATGAALQPRVQSIQLSGHPGIAIQPKEGTWREIQRMDMRGITIGQGGSFAFDYDLSIESMAEGMMALGQLLGLAMGQPVSGRVPDVKLAGIRAEIDARLQAEVPPRFRAFLQQYDRMVPGVSLMQVFG